MSGIPTFESKDAKDLAGIDKVWKKENISLGMLPRTKREFIRDCQKAICFVAKLNNKIIGYVLGEKKVCNKKRLFYLKKGERYVNLESLYMLKEHRNKNVGKRLIMALVKESKKQGFDSIHVVADSVKQEKLISFYKKHGFKFVFTRMKLKLT